MTRNSTKELFREAGTGSAVAAAVGIFSFWLYLHGGGLAAEQGPSFYGADIFRVRENLLHPLSQAYNYSNLTMHPLFGLICVATQMVHKITGFSEYQIYALMAVLQGALSGLLLYACGRLWGASTALALAIVAFYCSTAGFVYWSSITETHVWAGMSLLIVVAIARWNWKQPEQQAFFGVISFTVSFSIVVSNVMVWLFSRLPLDRASPREVVRALFQQSTVLRIATEMLAGLGMILLGYTVTRSFLPGGHVGTPLAFGQEAQFVRPTFVLPFNGFNAMGLIAPRLDYTTSGAVFVNAAFGLMACATVFLVPPRLRFLPAFLAFALLFHSLFARFQGFLFSGIYTAAASLVLGLALSSLLGRRATIALFALSVPLAFVNVTGFFDAVARQAAGQGSVTPPAFVRDRTPSSLEPSGAVPKAR